MGCKYLGLRFCFKKNITSQTIEHMEPENVNAVWQQTVVQFLNCSVHTLWACLIKLSGEFYTTISFIHTKRWLLINFKNVTGRTKWYIERKYFYMFLQMLCCLQRAKLTFMYLATLIKRIFITGWKAIFIISWKASTLPVWCTVLDFGVYEA